MSDEPSEEAQRQEQARRREQEQAELARQAELRDAVEQRIAREQEREQQRREELLRARGEEIKAAVEVHIDRSVMEPHIASSAAENALNDLVRRGVTNENFDISNELQRTAGKAVSDALEAEQLRHDKELAAEEARKQEQKDQVAKAHDAAVREPIPGSIQGFIDKIEASQNDKRNQDVEQSRAQNDTQTAKDHQSQEQPRSDLDDKLEAQMAGKELSEDFIRRMSSMLGRIEREQENRPDRYAALTPPTGREM